MSVRHRGRALVTGGAGFIGSALVRALLDDGWSVRVLDNLMTGSADNVPSEAGLLVGDLRVEADVRKAVEGIDVVFHQAAIRSVAQSVEDPMLTETCNAQGTLALLLAAADAGVRRVVNASSCAVYGDAGEGEIDEERQVMPCSPYAVSKVAAEHYATLFSRERRLQVVTLRYFNVFGPGQRLESMYSAVFPAFVSAVVAGIPPEVHWDGEQTRDFVAVGDIVRANIAAAQAPDSVTGRVYNVGGGAPRSINAVLAAVCRVVGVDVTPRRAPRRPGDIRHSSGSIARASRELGWEPRASFERVVAQTVAWYRSRHEGAR